MFQLSFWATKTGRPTRPSAYAFKTLLQRKTQRQQWLHGLGAHPSAAHGVWREPPPHAAEGQQCVGVVLCTRGLGDDCQSGGHYGRRPEFGYQETSSGAGACLAAAPLMEAIPGPGRGKGVGRSVP